MIPINLIKRISFLILLLVVFSVTGKSQSVQGQKKPNVIIILTDQWRSSALGYTGNDVVQTPHLDKFSKESINLTNAVSVTPVCTPHRASLLTGKYPTSTGMFLNDIYLPSEELCMAEIFKAAGYQTALIGKWHLDGHGRDENVIPARRQGFDYWKGSECSHSYNEMVYYANDDPEKRIWEGYATFSQSIDAQKYLSDHAADKEPFLLYLTFATPHFPHHTAPKDYQALYPDSKLKLDPNVPVEMKKNVFKELRGYYAHCTATDKAIGDFITKLKELKIYDNSIIVFTSDHGEMMGAHGVKPTQKQLPWNESAHIPFLISYPGIGKNKGKKLNAPITTPDILPTLLGLTNINIPTTIEGENLSKLIKKCDPKANRAALFMNIFPFNVNINDPAYRAIRTNKYSYIKTLDRGTLLFDNTKDPYQLTNLYDNHQFKNIRKDLEKQLNARLTRIGDEDFNHPDYYLKKWGFILNAKDREVKWDFADGEPHIVQSPKNNK